MAKCPKCGKELPPDGGTCEYCTVDLRRKRHSTRFKRFEDAVDAPPEPAPAPEPQAPDETEDDEDEGERTFVLKHGAIQEPAEIEEPAGPSGEEGLLPASALQESWQPSALSSFRMLSLPGFHTPTPRQEPRRVRAMLPPSGAT